MSSNAFLNGLTAADNYKLTENGGLAYKSTLDSVYDMFAFGGAYRSRSEEDCILLFKNAYEENAELALRCLFYLRDIVCGQGERRFFRTCMKWLAKADPQAVRRNINWIPELGRWDDLYTLMDTPCEKDALEAIKWQLAQDATAVQKPKTPVSLCAKWCASINASSPKTRELGEKTRKYLGMSHRRYRKLLSVLRERINIVERLMSENRWDEIDFSALPSKAGLQYRKAFMRHDVERKYENFIKDENTTVNAGTLYPYDVVNKAVDLMGYNYHWYKSDPVALDNTERLAINKYWDNLADYFKDKTFNGLAVVDTSGSMMGQPINVAISLGMYCAERAKGPFAGHYVSFASCPQLIKVEGVDFCDKVRRIYTTNLCDNTNLEATFDLLLKTAEANCCKQEDLPKNIIVISDMEVDAARGYYDREDKSGELKTMMELMRKKWARHGYKMPKLVYWNVNARNDTVLDMGPDISLVSGASPITFEMVMTGKTGKDLMLDKLNSERYAKIS